MLKKRTINNLAEELNATLKRNIIDFYFGINETE